MSFYINPNGESSSEGREQWLAENAKLDFNPIWGVVPSARCMLCLIFNGPFEALAVAYNKAEFDELNDYRDHRLKLWYLADKEKVVETVPEMTMEDFK